MSFEEIKIICSFELSHIRFSLYGKEKSDLVTLLRAVVKAKV